MYLGLLLLLGGMQKSDGEPEGLNMGWVLFVCFLKLELLKTIPRNLTLRVFSADISGGHQLAKTLHFWFILLKYRLSKK